MTEKSKERIKGYGAGNVETVISVDEVVRRTAAIAEEISPNQLDNLADGKPYVSLENLEAGYGQMRILHGINLRVARKQSLCLIGPNGAGKSTMIKAVLDLIPKASGRVSIYGKPYKRQRRLVAYVPQRETVDWDFPVHALDVVTMGRYGQIGWCKPVTRAHKDQAMAALERVGMADYARRQISQLSGGQQQRVFLARALVQEAQIYFMDEPSSGVDAATEKAIITLLQDLRSSNKTVLVVHHDLQTVSDYFDYLILLNMRIVAAGSTRDVFTKENLHKTYGGRLTLLDEAAQAIAR